MTRLLPGAFATALLGDLGADVIKVEQPGVGDPMRSYEPKIGHSSAFTWMTDRNKRSIAVDLRSPRGVEVVTRLAAGCDLALESFRPGVADRLGLGYSDLRRANPKLVYGSLSGFGSSGPFATRAGHDLNYVGRAGLVGVGGIDGRPAIPGTQVGDLSGSLLGVAGILAALVGAQRTGQGDHIDVSLTDAAFSVLTTSLAPYLATGRVPEAGSEMLTGGYPCYQLYRCADNRMLTVGALETPFWHALCEAVGRPDLEPTQFDRDALPVWRELFLSRTQDEWLEVLGDADTCTGPVNDLSQAAADPQLQHREMIVEQADASGVLHPQVGVAIKLRERPGSIRTPAPEVGADTRQLLEETGWQRHEIEELISDRVVMTSN